MPDLSPPPFAINGPHRTMQDGFMTTAAQWYAFEQIVERLCGRRMYASETANAAN